MNELISPRSIFTTRLFLFDLPKKNPVYAETAVSESAMIMQKPCRMSIPRNIRVFPRTFRGNPGRRPPSSLLLPPLYPQPPAGSLRSVFHRTRPVLIQDSIIRSRDGAISAQISITCLSRSDCSLVFLISPALLLSGSRSSQHDMSAEVAKPATTGGEGGDALGAPVRKTKSAAELRRRPREASFSAFGCHL